MLGRKKSPEVHSCIAAGMHVTGDCTFEGTLRIDGTVRGNVRAVHGAASTLTIGESGRVEGAVCADAITIDGTVLGPVAADGALALHAHAQIEGNVRYQTLEMQPGATIAGQLQPQLAATDAPDQTPLPPSAPEAAGLPATPTPNAPTEPTLDMNRSLDLG